MNPAGFVFFPLRFESDPGMPSLRHLLLRTYRAVLGLASLTFLAASAAAADPAGPVTLRVAIPDTVQARTDQIALSDLF